ncbi:MAG: rRNA pseudouridine synthase [Verrucomicrobiae bacterium]|nr:rRNA pseudouridine synthase [Verrucomicrobiae bacterium]
MKREAFSDADVSRAVRLNSFLAQAGLGSRRRCEELIRAGAVRIGGEIVRELATRVAADSRDVTVDGRPVLLQSKRYIAFHKPKGLLCSRAEHPGSRTIYQALPSELRSLFYVGRLDRDSEGLLFLTNDGDWAQRIAHPRAEVEKVYRVELDRPLEDQARRRALAGVRDEGEMLKFEKVRAMPGRGGRGAVVEVVLREGKKREIRRLFRALHHRVHSLKRLSIGGVELGDLPAGRWRELTTAELSRLACRSPSKAR